MFHALKTTLTDEDNNEQAQMVQLYVGVGEGVAEGGVDDHEQNDAAHRPERRLPAVQTLSQKPPTHLHAQNMFNHSSVFLLTSLLLLNHLGKKHYRSYSFLLQPLFVIFSM